MGNRQSEIHTTQVESFETTSKSSKDSLVADDVTSNIIQGLNEVKLIKEGKLPSNPLNLSSAIAHTIANQPTIKFQ